MNTVEHNAYATSPCETILELFERYLVTRRQSPATIRNRLSYVRRFMEDHDPLTVRPWPIEEWVHSHGWQDESVNGAVTALRKFFQWLQRSEQREDDPSIDLKTVSLRRKHPRVADEQDIREALSNARPAVQLMILLGAECGLRRAEIAQVHRDDIRGDRLRVVGKGGRERFVFLSEQVLALLERMPTTGWVFPATPPPGSAGHGTTGRFQRGCRYQRSCPGDPRTGRTCREANRESQRRQRAGIRQIPAVDSTRHMSPDSVYQAMYKALGGNPHSLRHRAATAVYRGSGNDIRVTQEFLGHSSPSMTARYVHVNDDDLRIALAAAALRGLPSAAAAS